MHTDYEDIKKRITDPILWYDKNGVPRYEPFHPDMSPNIYAQEVILLLIECQACAKQFLVEMNWDQLRKIGTIKDLHPFSQIIKNYQANKEGMIWSPLHYGDPPRHEDCVGESMNCFDRRVVEFWQRNEKTHIEWQRVTKYEIELETTNE